MSGPRSSVDVARAAEQFKAIAESTSTYVCVKDLDGRYALASRRVDALAGQPVVGKTDRELFAREVAEEHERRERAALERRQPVEAVQALAGRRHLTMAIPLLSAGGEPYAVFVTAIDVADEPAITDRAIASQRLALLGHLTAEVAHELQSVLNVVLTLSDLVLDSTGDERTRQDVALIGSAARRGTDLTRQLLSFGSQTPADAEPAVTVAEAVGDVERLLTRIMGPAISIETHLESGAAVAEIGSSQLAQVLLNLATNARDAMPGGGRIVISAAPPARAPEHLTPPLDSARDYIRLSLSDTGSGMAPDVAARALEPYFTTKSRGYGSGLGLAMVQEILAQAGGALDIDTSAGRGTTVAVYLPAAGTRRSPRFEGAAQPCGRGA